MEFLGFWRENKQLLSRFLANLIIGIRRIKKESCSTHRGLRVDSDFGSFRQTP